MTISEIRTKIESLHKEHLAASDGVEEAEWIETQCEDLIVDYCEKLGYLINGFPTEKRKQSEQELNEDYFCRERLQLYLDTLLVSKNDVADLMWFYSNLFWPGQFKSKEEIGRAHV